MKSHRLAAVFPAAILLAFGCRGGDAPASGPHAKGAKTVIRYLAGPDIGGAHAENIARFQKLYPDIEVQRIEGASATDVREARYAASLEKRESTFDLVFLDVIWVPRFASKGWLLPLDGRFPQRERERFLWGEIEGSRYGGKLYRVPMQASAGLLYYRKDLLEKYGIPVPQTWMELVSAAERIQRPPGLWGFAFQGKAFEGLVCDYLEMAWGNDAEIVDAWGKVRADEPAAVEALASMAGAVRTQKISPPEVLDFEEEDTRRFFQNGKAVFMRNWPYAWRLMERRGSPVRGKVGIAPMVRGRLGKRGYAVLGGWGFGVSAFSKHPDAAWKFAWFMASPESQKVAFLKAGLIPTRKRLFNDPEIIARSPHYRMLFEVFKGARPRPVRAEYARLSAALQTRLHAALAGDESPKDALDAASREMRDILEK